MEFEFFSGPLKMQKSRQEMTCFQPSSLRLKQTGTKGFNREHRTITDLCYDATDLCYDVSHWTLLYQWRKWWWFRLDIFPSWKVPSNWIFGAAFWSVCNKWKCYSNCIEWSEYESAWAFLSKYLIVLDWQNGQQWTGDCFRKLTETTQFVASETTQIIQPDPARGPSRFCLRAMGA